MPSNRVIEALRLEPQVLLTQHIQVNEVPSRMTTSLRENLRDPARRFLVMALIVVGVILVLSSQQRYPQTTG